MALIAGRAWRAERDDAVVLAAVAVLVPLVWWVALGWQTDQAVAGGDATAAFVPYYRELAKVDGDWREVQFRASLMGGARLHDVYATPPIVGWTAWLGLAPATAVNVICFAMQTLLGFLGARAATGLAARWGAVEPAGWTRHAVSVGVAMMFAFSPLVGARIGAGHLSLLAGFLPFVAAAAVIVGARAGTLTMTTAALAVWAFAEGASALSQQVVLASVVFGGPLLVGLAFTGPAPAGTTPARALALGALVAAAGVGLVLDRFASMAAYATSDDASRASGSASLVYSYGTASARDWLASIFWKQEVFATGRDASLLHETLYPLGPPLLLLAGLLPWRRERLVGGLLVGGAVLGIALGSHWPVISDALLAAVPMLDRFRVPARAFIPIALAVQLVALAALVASGAGATPRRLAWGLLAIPVLWWMPARISEIAGWGLAAAVVVGARRGARQLGPAAIALVVALLMAAAVPAFRERQWPAAPASVYAAPDAIGDAIRARAPELADPLVRASVYVTSDETFATNAAWMSGISTVDGYWPPLRGFLSLLLALHGQPYEPTAILLSSPATSPGFAALRQLYNIRYDIVVMPAAMRVRELGPTAGRAWFSGGIDEVDSVAAAAARALGAGDDLYRRAHERVWVVRGAARPAMMAAACAGATVAGVHSRRGGQRIDVDVVTAAACPLTVATNHSVFWRARADGRAVTTFAGYGALLSVIVPAGTSRVSFEAMPGDPAPARFAGLALALLAIVGAVWVRKPNASGDARRSANVLAP